MPSDTYPGDTGNVFLALIELQNPPVLRLLAYGYATLWFTTPWIGGSLALSLVALVVYRQPSRGRPRIAVVR